MKKRIFNVIQSVLAIVMIVVASLPESLKTVMSDGTTHYESYSSFFSIHSMGFVPLPFFLAIFTCICLFVYILSIFLYCKGMNIVCLCSSSLLLFISLLTESIYHQNVRIYGVMILICSILIEIASILPFIIKDKVKVTKQI